MSFSHPRCRRPLPSRGVDHEHDNSRRYAVLMLNAQVAQ